MMLRRAQPALVCSWSKGFYGENRHFFNLNALRKAIDPAQILNNQALSLAKMNRVLDKIVLVSHQLSILTVR